MLHERDFAVLHVYKDTEIALYREREKGSMCYLSMCVLSQHTCVSKVGSCMHLWAPSGEWVVLSTPSVREHVFVDSFARTNEHAHDSRLWGLVTDMRVFVTPTAPEISQSYSPGPRGERNCCHVC